MEIVQGQFEFVLDEARGFLFENPNITILGLYRDNGKENGNYYIAQKYNYSVLGLYRDNGKENGNHYITLNITPNITPNIKVRSE